MKRIDLFLGLVVLLGSILASCDGNKMYEENLAVDGNTWMSDDIKTFSFDVTDTMSLVNIFINLRTTTDYPYSNIYMFMETEFPGLEADVDTLEFILAKPSGEWVGDNSGTIVEFRALIASGGRLASPGAYTFKLQHAMREKALPEIVDVGIRVETMELD